MIGEKEYGTPITQLPYNMGDTVYYYDLSNEVIGRAEIVMLGVMKKAEWKQIKVTLKDCATEEELRRTIGKTVYIRRTFAGVQSYLIQQLIRAQRRIARLQETYKPQEIKILLDETN